MRSVIGRSTESCQSYVFSVFPSGHFRTPLTPIHPLRKGIRCRILRRHAPTQLECLVQSTPQPTTARTTISPSEKPLGKVSKPQSVGTSSKGDPNWKSFSCRFGQRVRRFVLLPGLPQTATAFRCPASPTHSELPWKSGQSSAD